MFAKSDVTGGMLRELRTVAGISLRKVAAKTHLSPAYLSEVETERKPVTPTVIDAYRVALGDDPTLDIDRLAATLVDPSSAGASAIEDVSVILDRTRHMEDQLGALAVAPVVRGIDSLARSLDQHIASEVSRYRGWIEHTVGNRAVADKVLSDAASLATDAPQRAHALSFRSLIARHDEDLPKALDLAEATIAADGVHPALAAFDRYWRGELLARMGETRAAAKAIAPEPTETDDLPPGGYWYTSGFLAVQRGLVLSCMGRQADGIAEASQGLAEMPESHRGADWIMVMLKQIDPEWDTSK